MNQETICAPEMRGHVHVPSYPSYADSCTEMPTSPWDTVPPKKNDCLQQGQSKLGKFWDNRHLYSRKLYEVLRRAWLGQKAFFSNRLTMPWISACLMTLLYIQGLILTGVLSTPENLGRSAIDTSVLSNMGALNANYIRHYGEWYRLIWSIFLHQNFWHIAINILCQTQLLVFVSSTWGFLRIFIVYSGSGLIGNLLSVVCNPCSTTVGCSGAIFGMMGAVGVFYLEHWKSMNRPGFFLLSYCFVLAFSVAWGFQDSIDNWAHAGGLLGGILLSLMTLRELKYSPLQSSISRKSLLTPLPPSDPWRQLYQNALNKLQNPFANTSYVSARKENFLRLLSSFLLIAFFVITFSLLFSEYEYRPIGHISLQSLRSCCCCYINRYNHSESNYLCAYCDIRYNSTTTWGQFCYA